MCLRKPTAQSAMLNYDTIEREACVIASWMCLMAATSWWAYGQSLQLQELLCSLLTEIMKKGLTTIFLPYTFRVGHFYCRTSFRTCQLALAALECYFTNCLHFLTDPAPAVEIPPESRHSTVAPWSAPSSIPWQLGTYWSHRGAPAGRRR